MKITCDTKKLVPLSELEPFQGDIKSISKKNLDKLVRSIETNGFNVPFIVWGNKIMDGHQRLKALQSKGYDGVVPVVEIEAENEKHAKELLLNITSQHGTFNIEGLQDFTVDLNMEDLDSVCLVDGPYINLDLSLGDTGEPDPEKNVTPLSDNIEVVEDSKDANLVVEECTIVKGQEIQLPDGTTILVGDDVYFAEEIVRHWNGRNKTKKVVL